MLTHTHSCLHILFQNRITGKILKHKTKRYYRHQQLHRHPFLFFIDPQDSSTLSQSEAMIVQ